MEMDNKNLAQDEEIEHLKVYCNMLKGQGFSDDEIIQIIQQQLSNQQDEFDEQNDEGSFQRASQLTQKLNIKEKTMNEPDQFYHQERIAHHSQFQQYSPIPEEQNSQLDFEFQERLFFTDLNEPRSMQQNYHYSDKENMNINIAQTNMNNPQMNMNNPQMNMNNPQMNMNNNQMNMNNNQMNMNNNLMSMKNNQMNMKNNQMNMNNNQMNLNNNQMNKLQMNKPQMNVNKPQINMNNPQTDQMKMGKNDQNNQFGHTVGKRNNMILGEENNSKQPIQKAYSRSNLQKSENQRNAVKIDQNEDQWLNELKQKLRTVFTFYVSFGDRINVSYLKSNKFHKMMSDAQLKDPYVLTQNRLDLLFVKENAKKHFMDFQNFLNLLAHIATLKFPEMSPPEALQVIIQNNFLPLYENIMTQTDMGQDEVSFKEQIDESPLLILKEINPLLLQIYQYYFAFEWRNRGTETEVKQKSETSLFCFLKEYEICPALITKSSAFLLFQEVLGTSHQELTRNPKIIDLNLYFNQNLGAFFTFQRFAIYLVRISSVCYENIFNQLEKPSEGADRTSSEKISFLLERMELSAGFLHLEKKNQLYQSLIIKKKMSQINSGNMTERQTKSIRLSQQSEAPQPPPHSICPQSSKSSSSLSTEVALSNNDSTEKHINSQISQTHSIKGRFQRSASGGRFQRSASGVKLHQGLSEIQQQRVRNYSPIGITSNQSLQEERHKYNVFQEVQRMQNIALFKNPLGLAELKCVQNVPLIDQNADILLAIFQKYCSFGDSLNTSSMTSSKFSKLLREASLLATTYGSNSSSTTTVNTDCSFMNQLNPSDVDLIFIKASKKKVDNQKQGNVSKIIEMSGSFQQCLNPVETLRGCQRLDFESFLVSLEMVASRMLRELGEEEQLTFLVENYLLSLADKVSEGSNEGSIRSSSSSVTPSSPNCHVQVLMDILKDPQVIELLGLIHKWYSQNKSTIDFEKFVRFCKDFGIFPNIIPKQKLLRIFNTLAQIYYTTDAATHSFQNNSPNKKPVIDQHLFVEAIALCAFEVPFSNPHPSTIERICYIVERMNQSGGQTMIQKEIGHTMTQKSLNSNWDILQPFRKRYPDIFESQTLCFPVLEGNSRRSNTDARQLNNQVQRMSNSSNNLKEQNIFDNIMKHNMKQTNYS